jgi:hypothetical protein
MVTRLGSVALAILIGLSSCATQSHVFLTGDSESAGAQIHVDGRKVGTMVERIYMGSTSDRPVEVQSEEELADVWGSPKVNGSVLAGSRSLPAHTRSRS